MPKWFKYLLTVSVFLFVSCSVIREGTRVTANRVVPEATVPLGVSRTADIAGNESPAGVAGGGKSSGETWSYLTAIEIPENTADAASLSYVDERFGQTKALVYETANPRQRLVVHTYASDNGTHRNYSLLMDGDLRCALWVACSMHSTGTPDNGVGRNDGWSYDPAIPEDWQFNGRYAESKIYDRGHQVASNDRQTTVDENRQTFYYTNMTPQFGLLNRGQWAKLESLVQATGAATEGSDTLYVVTGPIFGKEIRYTEDKAGARLAVPDGYFKCLLKCRFDAEGKALSADGCAYLFESNSANVTPSQTSIDAVEKLTGLNLFSSLPDSIEDPAESKISL